MKPVAMLICALLLLASGAPAATAAPPGEARKIDVLIAGVAQLRGAQFIRNGVAYDGQAAAAHLRYKRAHARGHCDTAADFIDHCASSSSMSHRPYEIHYADGRIVTAAAYFHAELQRIQNPPRATSPAR